MYWTGRKNSKNKHSEYRQYYDDTEYHDADIIVSQHYCNKNIRWKTTSAFKTNMYITSLSMMTTKCYQWRSHLSNNNIMETLLSIVFTSEHQMAAHEESHSLPKCDLLNF